jgi:hypothetical protein
MTLQAFKDTLSNDQPSTSFPPLLQSLWFAAKGDWDRAHTIADHEGGSDGDWIHAYLHRVEGDNWNADYWYRRAGRSRPNSSLDEEWAVITQNLLERLDT